MFGGHSPRLLEVSIACAFPSKDVKSPYRIRTSGPAFTSESSQGRFHLMHSLKSTAHSPHASIQAVAVQLAMLSDIPLAPAISPRPDHVLPLSFCTSLRFSHRTANAVLTPKKGLLEAQRMERSISTLSNPTFRSLSALCCYTARNSLRGSTAVLSIIHGEKG